MPDLEKVLEKVQELEKSHGGKAKAQHHASGKAAAAKDTRPVAAVTVRTEAPTPAPAAEPELLPLADTPIFVHFIPPPLRAAGKSDLSWIVHRCDGGGCREAKHVSFHSMTGFSTFEGQPPEQAEGLACGCTIANHHLRGYGVVRWEGEVHKELGGPCCAVVEDSGTAASIDQRHYMQKAKKLQAQVKDLERALQEAKQRANPLGSTCSSTSASSLHASLPPPRVGQES
jgi:hypothetical protein